MRTGGARCGGGSTRAGRQRAQRNRALALGSMQLGQPNRALQPRDGKLKALLGLLRLPSR